MTDADLETVCAECQGGGKSYGDQCVSCRGAGTIPTEAGEKVLALIRNHLPALVRDSRVTDRLAG